VKFLSCWKLWRERTGALVKFEKISGFLVDY
jgi:hypothetical protein